MPTWIRTDLAMPRKKKEKKRDDLYRKISMRMHADAKYRNLSKPQPCGQALWWNILAGEQTGVIPGLMKIGEAAFAEQLGWPLKGFRDSVAEVVREGLCKFDWNSRLVFVPNALKHNLPRWPNVVKSWKQTWQHLPECPLKVEAYQHMESVLAEHGDSFLKAFREYCRITSPTTSPTTSPIQEQEQEQDYSIAQQGTNGDARCTKKSIPPTLDAVKAYCVERKNSVNPEAWFDHYTANGWKVGKNRMKDWQAAVRTWERNGISQPAQGDEPKQKPITLEVAQKLNANFPGARPIPTNFD